MNQKKLKSANERFDYEELRFNRRFSVYQLVTTPSFCHYKEFKERDLMEFNLTKFYEKAKEDFEAARIIYEKTGEHKMVFFVFYLFTSNAFRIIFKTGFKFETRASPHTKCSSAHKKNLKAKVLIFYLLLNT
jgi:hypothetical protein